VVRTASSNAAQLRICRAPQASVSLFADLQLKSKAFLPGPGQQAGIAWEDLLKNWQGCAKQRDEGHLELDTKCRALRKTTLLLQAPEHSPRAAQASCSLPAAPAGRASGYEPTSLAPRTWELNRAGQEQQLQALAPPGPNSAMAPGFSYTPDLSLSPVSHTKPFPYLLSHARVLIL